MNKNFLKSTVAILAGFFIVFVLSIGTDFILTSIGFFPPRNEPDSYTSPLLLVALIYRSAYTVAGGYAAAALAPNRPTRHAVILGVMGVIASSLGAVANWEKSSASTAWYPVALVVTALPCTWSGGKLFGIKK